MKNKKLNIVTYKVLDCAEIPEELRKDHWLLGCIPSNPDSSLYVLYNLTYTPMGNTYDKVDHWIQKHYPELEDTCFLIEIN